MFMLLAGIAFSSAAQIALAGSSWWVTPEGGLFTPARPGCVKTHPFPHARAAGHLLLFNCNGSMSTVGDAGGRTRQSEPAFITVTYPTGARIQAELADTPQKRSRGLMFRDRLAPDAGMLFVFEEPGEWSFWMKNTTVALDILWLGPDKRIVSLEENVPGCRRDPCPEYKPGKDALYVLELPAGSVKRENLTKGMKLAFDLPK